MLSKIFDMMYDAKFPWVSDGGNPRHACPDGYYPVIFELEKID